MGPVGLGGLAARLRARLPGPAARQWLLVGGLVAAVYVPWSRAGTGWISRALTPWEAGWPGLTTWWSGRGFGAETAWAEGGPRAGPWLWGPLPRLAAWLGQPLPASWLGFAALLLLAWAFTAAARTAAPSPASGSTSPTPGAPARTATALGPWAFALLALHPAFADAAAWVGGLGAVLASALTLAAVAGLRRPDGALGSSLGAGLLAALAGLCGASFVLLPPLAVLAAALLPAATRPATPLPAAPRAPTTSARGPTVSPLLLALPLALLGSAAGLHAAAAGGLDLGAAPLLPTLGGALARLLALAALQSPPDPLARVLPAPTAGLAALLAAPLLLAVASTLPRPRFRALGLVGVALLALCGAPLGAPRHGPLGDGPLLPALALLLLALTTLVGRAFDRRAGALLWLLPLATGLPAARRTRLWEYPEDIVAAALVADSANPLPARLAAEAKAQRGACEGALPLFLQASTLVVPGPGAAARRVPVDPATLAEPAAHAGLVTCLVQLGRLDEALAEVHDPRRPAPTLPTRPPAGPDSPASRGADPAETAAWQARRAVVRGLLAAGRVEEARLVAVEAVAASPGRDGAWALHDAAVRAPDPGPTRVAPAPDAPATTDPPPATPPPADPPGSDPAPPAP